VVGHTYVNDNTVGVNTVAGFDRHADGSLTPLSGSPFTIGGAGLGRGLGSQGAIQATPDGRYLLAVDAGSKWRTLPPGLPAVRDPAIAGPGSPVDGEARVPVGRRFRRSAPSLPS